MTSEQRALLIEAKLGAKYAHQMLRDSVVRGACSRSYYAMFCVARAILLDFEQDFSKHTAVISAFGKLAKKDDRIPESYHRKLLDAYKLRGTADYDYVAKVTREKTQVLIQDANLFVELGETWFGGVSIEEEE